MILVGNQDGNADLVVLYGNCQTPFLAQLFAAADPGKGYLCVLNHAPPGQQADKPTPEQMQRCVLYLEQYDSQPDIAAWTPLGDLQQYGLPLRAYLRSACPRLTPRIVFPSFVLTCLWPFAAIGDPRNTPEPGYVWGRYPYGNRLALEVLASGLTGTAALAAYQKRSAERLPPAAATLEKARRKLDARDTHCDVKIADYVWANLRDTPLFLTYAHVRTEAIVELATRLYTAMHPLTGSNGDAGPALDRLHAAAVTLPPMGPLEEPIDPMVAQALGLSYGGPGTRYRWYDQLWTFEDYMLRYLTYDKSW